MNTERLVSPYVALPLTIALALTGELATVYNTYEALLCNRYRKSIPYFEEKNNPFDENG
jgi:hypothetical protein